MSAEDSGAAVLPQTAAAPDHQDAIEARRLLYPDFFRVAAKLQAGDIDFAQNPGKDSDDERALDTEKLIEERPLHEANSFSSRVIKDVFGPLLADRTHARHVVAIDLDMDAVLIPTTTPGHHHLIIDKELTWAQYASLLFALWDVGLIQDGYYRACMHRKASWLRTPWTAKPTEEEPF